jgi:Fe-S cluster biogenesis protein NfuA
MTLKTGVERVQKEEVPELKEVVAFEKHLTASTTQ